MGQAESTEISTPNKTRIVRVLSAHHATIQGRQSKDFPKGWMMRDIPRSNQSYASHDTYWYSPECKFMFRSKPEVQRFLECLEEVKGNARAKEEAAMELYLKPSTTKQSKKTGYDYNLGRVPTKDDVKRGRGRPRKHPICYDYKLGRVPTEDDFSNGTLIIPKKSNKLRATKKKEAPEEEEEEEDTKLPAKRVSKQVEIFNPRAEGMGQLKTSKIKLEEEKKSSGINVGDVGYTFRKQFEDGWYSGEVIKIRHGAAGGRDRRCVYDDGDSEDLSLVELNTLLILDPRVKKKSTASTIYKGVVLPLPQYGRYYKKSEAVLVITQYPKGSKERTLAIEGVKAKGYVPVSTRNIYRLLELDEQGISINDTPWKVDNESASPLNDPWEIKFNEIKEYKRKYGDTKVRRHWSANPQLATWVASQRSYAISFIEGDRTKRASITADKIARLHNIGFAFYINPTERTPLVDEYLKRLPKPNEPVKATTGSKRPIFAKWHQRFNELKEYKKRFGNSNVPFEWEGNPQLAVWVNSQRCNFRKFVDSNDGLSFSEKKTRMLMSLDFDFNPKGSHPKSEEYLQKMKSGKQILEDSDDDSFELSTKSGRFIKKPRKLDESPNYEYTQPTNKRARMMEPPSPDNRARLFSSFSEIPLDTAAISTLTAAAGSSRDTHAHHRVGGEEEGEEEEDDDKEWLESVAASLGAGTRQKSYVRPAYRSTNSSLDGQWYKPSAKMVPNRKYNSLKSDSASMCSSTNTGISEKRGNDGELKQPPESVLVPQPSSPQPSADIVSYESLPLLNEIAEGGRHERLVFCKNDPKCLIGESILEHNSTWVSVSIDGELKKLRASQLVVVPSDKFEVGDNGPPPPPPPMSTQKKASKKSPSKSAKTKMNEKKFSAQAIDSLFCWFCETCDDKPISMLEATCQSCNNPREDESKTSILLEIVDRAVDVFDDETTISEVMQSIPLAERPSIPEHLVKHLLDMLSGKIRRTAAPFQFKPSTNIDDYFYWFCGACTMKNNYRRKTCSACAQGMNLADRSPLLKVAEEAAKNCQTTDEALDKIPQNEKLLIPRVVLDTLVTCIFIIEGRNGQSRRCRKQKKDGYDYCEGHIHPSLLSKPPIDVVKKDSTPKKDDTGDAEPLESPEDTSPSHLYGPSVPSKIAAISDIMPSFLNDIQESQANGLNWTINCIEDSIMASGGCVFPLGMKVRRFFGGYGFHDGRIIKVTRKIYKDEGRPVLVYRIRFNDDDQEDLLHHEITSLSQLYDRRRVDPEAPPDAQIPPGTILEMRSGHTIEVIEHKTPFRARQGEGGNVVVKMGSKTHELSLLQLEKMILRKVADGQPQVKQHWGGQESMYQSPARSIGSPTFTIATPSSSSVVFNANPNANPVLEWANNRKEDSIEANDEFDICEGLTLHRKRSKTTAAHVNIPSSTTINNPRDVRPGCKQSIWDPAACAAYLSWDPYAASVCDVCGIDKDDNLLIICDGCMRGYHTYCLRPIMTNIPKGNWYCRACAGPDSQIPFKEYSDNMSGKHEEIYEFLNLPFKSPSEFFTTHHEAIELFKGKSQGAVKQNAISRQIPANQVVFDVGNIKFIRSPEKNDWRLPWPLVSEDEYTSSMLSMVASMKYCGMESNLDDLSYKQISEEMNDPSIEVDEITPMSRRNLEIFQAFKHNIKQGIHPPLQIIYDENFGFSCKSLANIPRQTIIAEYLGEVVTWEMSGQSNSDSLMVLLDSGDPETSLIVDPTNAGNTARFLSGVNNRSSMSKRKQNVRTRRFFMHGRLHVCLFTSRDIKAGETLNYDYNAGNEGKDVSQWAKSGFYDTSAFF